MAKTAVRTTRASARKRAHVSGGVAAPFAYACVGVTSPAVSLRSTAGYLQAPLRGAEPT